MASYLGLFTVESWREFKRHGGAVMGFNEKKRSAASRLQPGDRILCYLSKVSAFVGVMEVAGPSYFDTKPIWSDGLFPVRIPVRIPHELPLANAVPIRSLMGQLSFLKPGPGWTIYVRSSPRKWLDSDARAVLDAVVEAGKKLTANGSAALPVSASTSQKAVKLPESVRVGKIIRKTRDLAAAEPAQSLGSYENVLSFNKVTGYSVNVPIAETCRPTAVCMKTCYFSAGAASWSNALRHQRKVMATMMADPAGFAERVALEYDNLGLTFLRWNGGGDLFAANVAAINHLGAIRPDIPIWVVTRLPEWATQIEQAPNVFIHFSLDKHSLQRRKDFLRLKPKSKNFFFSYQCDKGEVPEPANLEGIAVLFFDSYQPTCDLQRFIPETVCPLNTRADITDVCRECRRCFNGEAVGFEKSESAETQKPGTARRRRVGAALPKKQVSAKPKR
jgi:hypothetical protein